MSIPQLLPKALAIGFGCTTAFFALFWAVYWLIIRVARAIHKMRHPWNTQ